MTIENKEMLQNGSKRKIYSSIVFAHNNFNNITNLKQNPLKLYGR